MDHPHYWFILQKSLVFRVRKASIGKKNKKKNHEQKFK